VVHLNRARWLLHGKKEKLQNHVVVCLRVPLFDVMSVWPVTRTMFAPRSFPWITGTSRRTCLIPLVPVPPVPSTISARLCVTTDVVLTRAITPRSAMTVIEVRFPADPSICHPDVRVTALTLPDTWLWFDDDKVKVCAAGDVAAAQAYLLFYQLRGSTYNDAVIL
jgi:hypothetical protein